jgi:hypothetical protein
MRAFLGISIMLAGVAAGIYLGFWWAFVGGIVAIIQEIKADELNAVALSSGVARVFLAGVIGVAVAIPSVAIGFLLWDSKK